MNTAGEPERGEKTIYSYGWIAWVWRAMIFAGLAGGLMCVWFGFLFASPVFYLIGVPLLVPAWFFGFVTATRIDLRDDGSLRVTTLLFKRRLLSRDDLGKPRTRLFVQGEFGPYYGPHTWIPVRGKLPIYLDLLAAIPDHSAFANVLRISKKELPGTANRRGLGE